MKPRVYVGPYVLVDSTVPSDYLYLDELFLATVENNQIFYTIGDGIEKGKFGDLVWLNFSYKGDKVFDYKSVESAIEIEWMRVEFKKDIHKLKEIYGSKNIVICWGVIILG